MSDPSATIIAALIGFVGGLVVARYTFRQKADELFLSGLQYLGGGSQVRNLGIAALSLAWESRRHRKHIASLLVGSAIYLLLESKQGDATHEIHNLNRLMRMLKTAKADGALAKDDQKALERAMDTKLASGPEQTPGLKVDTAELRAWMDALGMNR